MRTHDGNNRANNWRFDADTETTEHFRRFSAIHDLLAPELMALAEEAQSTSAPIVRHLALQYPEDRETWDVHDQFLLGPDLLVAPVVREGLVEREVYFPEGTWFDVWTGEAIDGGQRLSVAAPIGRPPVFHRDTDRTDIRRVP